MTNASILESLEQSSKDLGKLDDGSLSSLGSKCHEIESTVAELENIEAHKKGLNQKLQKLYDETAELLRAKNLTSLTLANGSKVTASEKVVAHIKKEIQSEAFDILRNKGFGDLIKREVKANFAKGEDSQAEMFIRAIEEQGLQPVDDAKIHPSTLKAFFKEQLDKGNPHELPLDLFGVHVLNEIKIRR
jgi:hypothetical protein|tara:strand:- start:1442 stop:2008 length:567 start_codon:yes stop_codon:yes gene_type:complete